MGPDQELMMRIAKDDRQALEILYDRFGSLVLRMASQVMPTRSDAEDAVQEVFVRLWRTASRYDENRAALVTWVMLITRRHLVDKMRRQKARPHVSASPAESDATREARFKDLMARMDGLPTLERTVVKEAYLGGKTLRQISEELQKPIGTIKSALSRALVKLRESATAFPAAPPTLSEVGDNASFLEDVQRALLPEPNGIEITRVQAIDEAVIRYLQRDPKRMREMPPRKFEELIAHLFEDMGCDVELTPQTRDHGRDVLIGYPTPFGRLLGIVECKRNADDRPIEPAVVERFLFTIRERDRASVGVIAATSRFTRESEMLEEKYSWQLKLRDFDHITEWLAGYGTWENRDSTKLWTPSKPPLKPLDLFQSR